jgi:hypothetical protein
MHDMMSPRLCSVCNGEISVDAKLCPHCGAKLTPSLEAEKKSTIREWLNETKKEYDELGGWGGLTNGQFVWLLIHKSFKNYFERANSEYFLKKYPNLDLDRIAKKLTTIAAKNAAILGAITGAAISTDEIVGIVTLGEFGVGIPANLAIAAAALGGEVILLLRFQLQLVATLAKLYGVPLDADDPEDILTILAFAMGGSVSEGASKVATKMGTEVTKRVTKGFFSKDTLAFVQRVAAKIGITILQRSIVKYTVPIASIAIGSSWNYVAIRTAGRLAIRHFKQH